MTVREACPVCDGAPPWIVFAVSDRWVVCTHGERMPMVGASEDDMHEPHVGERVQLWDRRWRVSHISHEGSRVMLAFDPIGEPDGSADMASDIMRDIAAAIARADEGDGDG